MTAHQPAPQERDQRVSLDGLDPEEALRALLQVDPNAKPVTEAQTEEEDPAH